MGRVKRKRVHRLLSTTLRDRLVECEQIPWSASDVVDDDEDGDGGDDGGSKRMLRVRKALHSDDRNVAWLCATRFCASDDFDGSFSSTSDERPTSLWYEDDAYYFSVLNVFRGKARYWFGTTNDSLFESMTFLSNRKALSVRVTSATSSLVEFQLGLCPNAIYDDEVPENFSFSPSFAKHLRVFMSYLFSPRVDEDPSLDSETLLQSMVPVTKHEQIKCLSLKKELNDYQIDGIAWMKRRELEAYDSLSWIRICLLSNTHVLYWNVSSSLLVKKKASSEFPPRFRVPMGGVLADEMGLGKTVEVLGLLSLDEHSHPRKTTLIVSPASISSQWEFEIEKWIVKGVFDVVRFDGRQDVVGLATCAATKPLVVLTTFSVLKQQVHFKESEFRGSKRYSKAYVHDSSQLRRVSFHRIVLDEAQEVESSTTKAAVMAQDISSERRWAVTGTPFSRRRSQRDLFGLFSFWKHPMLAHSYGFMQRAFELRHLQLVGRRHTKSTTNFKHVELVRIPVAVEFTEIERAFYESTKRNIVGLEDFTALRKACVHASVVLENKLGTLDEILKHVLEERKTAVEEALRLTLMHLNGLAALTLDAQEACALYRKALMMTNSNRFKADSLQKIHALTHLAELLGKSSLEGARLTKTRDSLKGRFLEKSNTKTKHLFFLAKKSLISFEGLPTSYAEPTTDEIVESSKCKTCRHYVLENEFSTVEVCRHCEMDAKIASHELTGADPKEIDALKKWWMARDAQLKENDELNQSMLKINVVETPMHVRDPRLHVLRSRVPFERRRLEMEFTLANQEYERSKSRHEFLLQEQHVCVICHDPLASAAQVAVIKTCGHRFCRECVEKAMLRSKRCPICRARTKASEVLTPDSSVKISPPNDATRTGSSKLSAVVRLLRGIDRDDKIIVFSQFPQALNLLYDVLTQKGLKSVAAVAKKKNAEKRTSPKDAVDEFVRDPTVRILLMPLKLGNHGLNLIVANHVVFVDPVVSLEIRDQATSRMHRIGQTKPKCFFYEFFVKNSVEERILEKRDRTADDWTIVADAFIRKTPE